MVQVEGPLHHVQNVLLVIILLGVQLACHVLEERIHSHQELHFVIIARQVNIQQQALLLVVIVLLDLLR